MLLPSLLLAFAVHDGQLVRDAAGTVVEADLTDTWTSDAGLARIAQHKSLRKISLAHTKVTDLGLEALKGLTEVRELNCYYAEYLTEDGIAHLRGWKNLERLNLRGTKVTSKVFEHLTKLQSLRDLDIAYTQVEDEGFEQLALLPKLERLAMGGNLLTGSALQALRTIPTLTHLDVGGIQRVDSGLWGLPLSAVNLERLGQLKQLRWLSLSGATLSDRGTDRPGNPEAERTELRDLRPLLGLVNLEFLDLTRQPVTDESVAPLSALPKLKTIARRLAPQPSERKMERGSER